MSRSEIGRLTGAPPGAGANSNRVGFAVVRRDRRGGRCLATGLVGLRATDAATALPEWHERVRRLKAEKTCRPDRSSTARASSGGAPPTTARAGRSSTAFCPAGTPSTTSPCRG
jgi:hypothetical protein